jgi:release factor glutamine methyltransferase
MQDKNFNNLNKTFARRIGKTLSGPDKNALNNDLPKVLYSHEKLETTKYKKVFFEIGYGKGEHFISQLQSNPENLYIGAEVYLNGVATVLKKLRNYDGDNYMLWPDDLDEMLEQMPNNSLDGIYVLFPDPWHKRKYLKKRLFNQERVALFKQKLKKDAFLAFASDIEDYFDAVHSIMNNDPEFELIGNSPLDPHPGYVQTKYHSKAIKEGRVAQFVSAILKSTK